MLNKQEREHKRLLDEIMLQYKLEVHNLQTLHQRLSHGLESRVGELEEEVDRMRLEVSQARRGWEEAEASAGRVGGRAFTPRSGWAATRRRLADPLQRVHALARERCARAHRGRSRRGHAPDTGAPAQV